MPYKVATSERYFPREYDIQHTESVVEGDGFSANLVYVLGRGKSCLDEIDFATVASYLKRTMEGGYNRATLADVHELIWTGDDGRMERRNL